LSTSRLSFGNGLNFIHYSCSIGMRSEYLVIWNSKSTAGQLSRWAPRRWLAVWWNSWNLTRAHRPITSTFSPDWISTDGGKNKGLFFDGDSEFFPSF
jgi:hypothetical protein